MRSPDSLFWGVGSVFPALSCGSGLSLGKNWYFSGCALFVFLVGEEDCEPC